MYLYPVFPNGNISQNYSTIITTGTLTLIQLKYGRHRTVSQQGSLMLPLTIKPHPSFLRSGDHRFVLRFYNFVKSKS